MLKNSVRLLLAIVRAKPRLALAPESKGRIAINVVLFNTPRLLLKFASFIVVKAYGYYFLTINTLYSWENYIDI